MKTFKDVLIPVWMNKLPRDHRGYPIPFIVMRDTSGRPHFTINDEFKRQTALKKDLCGICGKKLLRRRALVGGPASAFHDHGAYVDGPLHIECARYALQVCPYLAAPNYSKRVEDRTLDPTKAGGMAVLLDPTMDPARPLLFVMAVCVGQSFTYHAPGVIRYVRPKKPYHAVEYWRGGEQLSDKEGELLSKGVLLKIMQAEVDDVM